MNESLIFFGAGGCGRETLAACRKRGIQPVLFVDNDPEKFGKEIEGIEIVPASLAQDRYPDALWVATIHRSFGAAKEVRDQIRAMGCKLGSLADYLPVMDGLPPFGALPTLFHGCPLDEKSCALLFDQQTFRRTHDYDAQIPPDPVEETYFPPFIKKIENEVFVDCGAYDGDTVRQFLQWQPNPLAIAAFEPDVKNFEKLKKSILESNYPVPPYCVGVGVSDHNGYLPFDAQGTFSSHFGSGILTEIRSLDNFFFKKLPQPTFIKMDIEGAELEALWGARKILKKHKPVLAICAYHTSDHLWEIPLLIHAIQPDYELRLRRYAEGARELVWYAVPKDRICTT